MFGSIKGKFKRWQEAGLISEEQSVAILAFEKERKSGKLIKDMTNVGIFAVLLGVASLVASNWSDIPPNLKLAGHFILNILVAGFMLRIDGVKHPVIKDACVLLLFGLFLTFIALIGQVYQLSGDIYLTLLVWLGLCTPFVWYFGRTYTVAVPWLGFTVCVLFVNAMNYIDHYREYGYEEIIATLYIFFLPTALILASRLHWLRRYRPGFAESFYRIGLYLPIIIANIALLLLYLGGSEITRSTIPVIIMGVGLLAIFFIFRPQKGDESATDLWYYLLVSHIIIMVPFALPDLESGVASAILFILYWFFIAWLGARMHSSLLMDWAIRLVILRLFIVYLEVFGSMMHTGLSLLVSGAILLVILRFHKRIMAVGRKLVNYEIG